MLLAGGCDVYASDLQQCRTPEMRAALEAPRLPLLVAAAKGDLRGVEVRRLCCLRRGNRRGGQQCVAVVLQKKGP